jgi:hypothetical protein
VLICSVGIALALLGSVLITMAMDVGGVDVPVSFSALTKVAGDLDPMWLKAGFVFILVGYGTKMGLAPMHTWLPDAHSEAPSPASALLSGVLLNCAYLGIFKTNKVMEAAGLGDFSGGILMVFGLVSIMAAATYILKQTEYKRMLAYSSIENMGIIAFGTGVGGLAAYGAIICLIHHVDQILPVPDLGQYPAGLRLEDDRRDRAAGQKDAADLCGLFRRVRRDFRLSALRHFHRRAFHHHRGLQGRPVLGRRSFHHEPVRHFRRLRQPGDEDILQSLPGGGADTGKGLHGLAPVRSAGHFNGALLLDTGHPLPGHC